MMFFFSFFFNSLTFTNFHDNALETYGLLQERNYSELTMITNELVGIWLFCFVFVFVFLNSELTVIVFWGHCYTNSFKGTHVNVLILI